MKNLYLGLKAQINTTNCPLVKYISFWNNQVEDMISPEGNKMHSFALPAVFFEFVNDNPSDQVGNGVRVYDPLDVNVHIVHDLYNASDGTMEVNLDIFDLEAQIHAALQLFAVQGADYGSGALNLVNNDRDYRHSNVYHSIPKYRTTWTDNSLTQPIGSGTAGPTLTPVLTVSKLPIDAPNIIASVNTLAFGNVVAGQTKTMSFTISGTGLKSALTMAVDNSLFSVSLDNVNFSTLEMITPEIDLTIVLVTIYVKFSPVQAVGISANLDYGVIGLDAVITLTGTGI